MSDATAALIDAPFVRRVIDRMERHRVFRAAFELALVAIAFLLYFAVRGSVVDRDSEALRNANDIIAWERALGIFWEPRLQELIIDHQIVIHLMNFIYFWLDFPLIVCVGVWMYFAHRHEYTVTRDAILLSGAIALIIYNLYPVMPPRLLPSGEFLGTVEKYSNFSYQAQSTQAFVNPYAAVPSLHFGWALILGGALVYISRNWLVRGFGLLLPWAQLASIVFTANHYILDAAVGLVVCLAGIWLALAMQRWGYPAIRREAARRWSGDPAPP
ncbi:MAG: phosphatase PAP2 family protein [Dehalococcoidia bacterium]